MSPWGPRGSLSTYFALNGGCSRTSRHCLLGPLVSTFSCWMVGVPGSLALPPRGAGVDVLSWMVGAPRSPTSLPKGATVDIFMLDGWRTRISDTTFQGGLPSTFFVLNGGHSRISSIASQGARCRCPVTKW
jgi:hypothetical protein